MSDPTPIKAPAGYAPCYAVGYADPADNFILVSESDPLPVVSFPPAPPPLAAKPPHRPLPGLSRPCPAASSQ